MPDHILTRQMLFPLRSVCESFVFFCPSGVLSLRKGGWMSAGGLLRATLATHYSVTSSSTMSVQR